MRENFDFVSMENYSKDMAELSTLAAGVAERQAKRIRDLEHLIWAIAKSAGGRLIVYDERLAELPKPGQLAFWRCEADRTIRIDAQ